MVEYVFKKSYTCDKGTLPEGSTIREVRGVIYFNGGMIPPAYIGDIRKIIEDKELFNEYLEARKVINNKI